MVSRHNIARAARSCEGYVSKAPLRRSSAKRPMRPSPSPSPPPGAERAGGGGGRRGGSPPPPPPPGGGGGGGGGGGIPKRLPTEPTSPSPSLRDGSSPS